MTWVKKTGSIFFLFLLAACDWNTLRNNDGVVAVQTSDSLQASAAPLATDSLPADNAQNKNAPLLPPSQAIDVKNVQPGDVVGFAKTLIGTPYVYASTDPTVGFDCSGFITYVFNHFGISVPRSSIDFTNVGKAVPVEQAKPGDLILFTGTNPEEHSVGHMGIVIDNRDTLQFIHSSSGKAMGVTITPLNDYYQSRFVRVTRIFPQNDTAP